MTIDAHNFNFANTFSDKKFFPTAENLWGGAFAPLTLCHNATVNNQSM